MTSAESNRAPWLENIPQTAQKPARKPRRDDPVPDDTRRLVRTRSGGVCELCGESPLQHLHHRQLRRGGDHSACNIVGLCNTCHTRCHGHVRWALDTGFIVSQYDDPALREVLWRGRDWVWLGSGGELLHVPPPDVAVPEPPC